MSYYDHATAMVLKLDRWSEEKPLRNYEYEALACNRLIATSPVENRLFLSRRIRELIRKKFAAVKHHSKDK